MMVFYIPEKNKNKIDLDFEQNPRISNISTFIILIAFAIAISCFSNFHSC